MDKTIATLILAYGALGIAMSYAVPTITGFNIAQPSLTTVSIVGICYLIQATTALRRRTHPAAMLWICTIADSTIALVPTFQHPPAEMPDSIAGFFLVYAVARWANKPLRTLIPVAAFTAATAATTYTLAPSLTPRLSSITAIGAAAIGGIVKVGIGALIGYLVNNNQKLAKAQQQTLIAEERTRIARELHDTTAHHLSSIAIQTTAARATIHTNPDLAEQQLEGISTSVTAALRDIRTTVDTLRSTTEAEERNTPQPTTDDIPTLISECQHLGMNITTTGSTLENTLSAPQQQTAYRILQEALTNARKHAPGAPVTINLEPQALTVRTHGNFPPGKPGTGTIGMQERAHSTGATLVNQATSTGWEVTLTWH